MRYCVCKEGNAGRAAAAEQYARILITIPLVNVPITSFFALSFYIGNQSVINTPVAHCCREFCVSACVRGWSEQFRHTTLNASVVYLFIFKLQSIVCQKKKATVKALTCGPTSVGRRPVIQRALGENNTMLQCPPTYGFCQRCHYFGLVGL